MTKYTEVQLVVWEYTTEQIILELKKGLLDCGIISTPLGDSILNEMPLFYENFVAHISKSSSLVNKKTITAPILIWTNFGY
jgi:LysR family hydrogen peroxide-inducible transcriptional activator